VDSRDFHFSPGGQPHEYWRWLDHTITYHGVQKGNVGLGGYAGARRLAIMYPEHGYEAVLVENLEMIRVSCPFDPKAVAFRRRLSPLSLAISTLRLWVGVAPMISLNQSGTVPSLT
jgi:hypothetical protein